jgi:hypothetical protein
VFLGCGSYSAAYASHLPTMVLFCSNSAAKSAAEQAYIGSDENKSKQAGKTSLLFLFLYFFLTET